MDKETTVQILTRRAESAENKVDIAVEQIESTARALGQIKAALGLVKNDVVSMDTKGKIDLLRDLIQAEIDYLHTWDIPF